VRERSSVRRRAEDLRRRLSRRRGLFGLAAILLAGGAGAFVALGPARGGDHVAVGGALAPSHDARFFSVSAPAEVGGRFSYGLLIATNRGDAAATLERVELVDADPGLQLVGAYAQTAEDPHPVGLLAGFPPEGASPARRPVRGYVVAPGRGVRVVVGIGASSKGASTAHALRLSYQVGERAYRADWPLAIRLCAPARAWADRCNPPRE
jgi:hypothetical protein